MELRIRLPKPHRLQREIMRSKAKRKVVVAGRRFGKTTAAGEIAADRAIRGQKILIVSTSQDQADAFWDKIRHWLAPLFRAKLAKKNEIKRVIELWSGGRIQCRTGKDPDVLRSKDADLLIMDECSRLHERAWSEVGAPMLADRDGDALFISTPFLRNWFYVLYMKAQEDQSRWQAWHATSHDNPYLSATALAEITQDMTEEAYKQEILAQFLEGEGAVFRYIREAATATRQSPYLGRFVMGIDWAQARDFTVITVLDAAKRTMVDVDRFNKVEWGLQRGRVRAMWEKWRAESIVCEMNSVGSPNFEALAREGLPVVPFTTSATTKPPLIENLTLALDRQELAILNEPWLIGELEAYERQVSPTTGRSQYSAPDGLHDDGVMSLALALWGAQESRRIWVA